MDKGFFVGLLLNVIRVKFIVRQTVCKH